MKFCEQITVQVGDDGVITLREPTAKEINEFQSRAYPVRNARKGKISTNASDHRVKFFDEIFIGVENCENEQGPIPADGKDRIPERYKNEIILHYVEKVDIDIKN